MNLPFPVGTVCQTDNGRILCIILGSGDPLASIQMIDIAVLTEWKDDFRGKFWVVRIEHTEDNCLRKPHFVDCANIMGVSANGISNPSGRVDDKDLRAISLAREEFAHYEHSEMEARRTKISVRAKYEYDIALSFAGEDRSIASQLARNLKKNDIRIFYDDFEKHNLWGKDLVQHLDRIYRQSARYCVILVSEHYARKIWTNHELKSALARSLESNHEYILPIQLDATELPGLRPTVGHIALDQKTNIRQAVKLIIGKLASVDAVAPQEFSPKWLDNILQINRLWNVRCTGFVVDPRFLVIDGMESRLAMSYGINVTNPRRGFLAPPEQQGDNVFLLHNVIVLEGYKLCLVDRDLTSYPSRTHSSLARAMKEAQKLCAEIPNDEYLKLTRFYGEEGKSGRSSRYLLDEFEISTEVG